MVTEYKIHRILEALYSQQEARQTDPYLFLVDYCQTIERRTPKRQKKLNPFVSSQTLSLLTVSFHHLLHWSHTSDTLFIQKRVVNIPAIQYLVLDVILPREQIPGRLSTTLLKTESVSQFHMNLLL